MSSWPSWGDVTSNSDKHNAEGTSGHEDSLPPDEQDQDQSLLVHITIRKPLPPGNVKCLMSPAANNTKPDKPQEVNLNGIIYWQVNTASIVYAISSCQSAGNKSSLVDRGANGGMLETTSVSYQKWVKLSTYRVLITTESMKSPLSQQEASSLHRRDL